MTYQTLVSELREFSIQTLKILGMNKFKQTYGIHGKVSPAEAIEIATAIELENYFK